MRFVLFVLLIINPLWAMNLKKPLVLLLGLLEAQRTNGIVPYEQSSVCHEMTNDLPNFSKDMTIAVPPRTFPRHLKTHIGKLERYDGLKEKHKKIYTLYMDHDKGFYDYAVSEKLNKDEDKQFFVYDHIFNYVRLVLASQFPQAIKEIATDEVITYLNPGSTPTDKVICIHEKVHGPETPAAAHTHIEVTNVPQTGVSDKKFFRLLDKVMTESVDVINKFTIEELKDFDSQLGKQYQAIGNPYYEYKFSENKPAKSP